MTQELWIARDNQRNALLLFQGDIPIWDAFKEYPLQDDFYWDGVCIAELKPTLFPEVTFSNSPQKVKLTLETEE